MLKDDTRDTNVVVNELKLAVATKIAKYAVPDQILVSQLPLRGQGDSVALFKSPLLSTNDSGELLQAQGSFHQCQNCPQWSGFPCMFSRDWKGSQHLKFTAYTCLGHSPRQG